MAAKHQDNDKAKKRKFISGGKTGVDNKTNSVSKKPRFEKPKHTNNSSGSKKDYVKKPFVSSSSSSKQHSSEKPKFQKSDYGKETSGPLTKREGRLQAKELAEARKKRRKRHYTLEQELALLWEKMRRRNISKEDRSKFVSEALEKMKGKISEIAGSHVSSRVLQTCVKYCSQSERDAVFEELQPHFLTLACNTYAVHLVKKLLDSASKKQLAGFISSLHGHVASLLRHMVGSVVVEHAYQMGNATQKQELLVELYSTELQLFKDLTSMKETRLVDIIPKLGLQKASVQRHMASVINPILEKGILDHSITHRALIEYFSIADKSSAADVIQQLSGPNLVRMIHHRDGSRIGMLCVKHGNAKERKKIIKGMKGHIAKIAHDQYGSMVLACILSTVDDTKIITKVVIRELKKVIKEVALDKNGRRIVLQLLHPNCSRYFSPDDLASLSLSIPSLCNKGEDEVISESKSSELPESGVKDAEINMEETVSEINKITSSDDVLPLVEGGKKDPYLRRQELLINSGLAESLINTCIESTGEFLRSISGREVIYELATGGADGILHPTFNDKLDALHEAIAALAAQPKSEESEEEHVLENFHSSRTIRKLVLDSSTFAATLWKKALKGSSATWAHGHSCKVVSAFLESSDSEVRQMAKKELQPLIDGGLLKTPETKQLAKEA